MTSDDGHNRIPSAIYEAQTTSWKSNSSLQPAIRPKRNEQQRCDIDDTRSSAMCAICGGCHHAQVLLNKQQPSSNDITTHNEKSRQRRSKNCRRPRSLLAELQISLFWVRIRLETLDQQTRIRCVDNTFHSHRRFVMFVCASHSFVAPESVYWPSVFRVFFWQAASQAADDRHEIEQNCGCPAAPTACGVRTQHILMWQGSVSQLTAHIGRCPSSIATHWHVSTAAHTMQQSTVWRERSDSIILFYFSLAVNSAVCGWLLHHSKIPSAYIYGCEGCANANTEGIGNASSSVGGMLGSRPATVYACHIQCDDCVVVVADSGGQFSNAEDHFMCVLHWQAFEIDSRMDGARLHSMPRKR